MTVSLKNTGRRPVTVMLDHTKNDVQFLGVRHDRRSGKMSLEKRPLTLPTSVTIPVGGLVTGLPDGTEAYPDVVAAQKSGDLKVYITKEVPATPAKAAKAAKRKGK